MSIKEVEKIMEDYRERALDENDPNGKARDIWNASVYVISCYILFKGNPIKNIKYAYRLVKKMRKLEKLMEGEKF